MSRLVVATAIPLLVILFLYVHLTAKTNVSGGFKRLFIPHPIGQVSQIDLDFNSYYLAGQAGGSLYLGNSTARGWVLQVDTTLHLKTILRYHIPVTWDNLDLAVAVSGDRIYFTEGNRGVILSTILTDTGFIHGHEMRTPVFTAFIPLSKDRWVLRTFNEKAKKSTLTLMSSDNRLLERDLLVSAMDGYYSCDGSASLDAKSRTFSYIYHFCNRLSVFDDSLRPVEAARTIDTVSVPELRIDSYRTGTRRSTTYSKPPFLVNRGVSADGGRLFVQSELRATNEPRDNFVASTVLDIYALPQATYQFSLYVPKNAEVPLTSFRVVGRQLFALQGRFLFRYSLNF